MLHPGEVRPVRTVVGNDAESHSRLVTMYHLRMDTTQPQTTDERSEDVSDVEAVAEELELVEEISIDGMCGVY